MAWVDQVIWMLLWGAASKSKQSQLHKYTDSLYGSIGWQRISTFQTVWRQQQEIRDSKGKVTIYSMLTHYTLMRKVQQTTINRNRISRWI